MRKCDKFPTRSNKFPLENLIRAKKGPGCYQFFFLFSRNAERMRRLEETYVNPNFVQTETEAHQYASLQYIANSQI